MSKTTWETPAPNLLTTLETHLECDNEAVLVTVVDVEGNAYRRPGAKMIVDAGGTETGLVTPGCLDEEIETRCQSVLEAGRPQLNSYDLSSDDGETWGLGVGCDGIITLLLEPIGDRHRQLVTASTDRKSLASLVILPNDADIAPERYSYEPEKGFESGTPLWLQKSLQDRLKDIIQEGAATVIELESPNGTVPVFVEGVRPCPTLVVIGSGNDVRPVVDVASRAGFRTVVVGYRGGKTTSDRFPDADAVVSTSPRNLTDAVDIDNDTLCVVMTHNFVDDQLTLEALLATSTPYIGLLGPRSRFQSLLKALDRPDGLTNTEQDRVYAPVGLDLGGEAPIQIALSIVSEALAVHNDSSGGNLRAKSGHIHDRIDE